MGRNPGYGSTLKEARPASEMPERRSRTRSSSLNPDGTRKARCASPPPPPALILDKPPSPPSPPAPPSPPPLTAEQRAYKEYDELLDAGAERLKSVPNPSWFADRPPVNASELELTRVTTDGNKTVLKPPSRKGPKPKPTIGGCPEKESTEERQAREFQSLKQMMCEFAADPEATEYVVPELNSYLRKVAHEIAEAFGEIGHVTVGTGNAREVHLTKEMGSTFELDPEWTPCERLSPDEMNERDLKNMLDQICAFASDPEKTSEALPPLNSFLRMKAHEHATALGIGHDSAGDGKARHIVLSKNPGETFEMEPLPASPAPPPRPAIKIILKDASPASEQTEERRALSDAAAIDDELWLDEWHERLGCWWAGLPMPTQSQLGACMGALGLHLGSKLDTSMRALGISRGATPSAPAAEPNCDWIQENGHVLELPQFPSVDSIQFTVPPIPRLLPSWEHLQAFALEEELLALGDVPQPPPSAAGLDAETFAAGFAAVVAASVGVWFGMRYFRQKQKTGRRVEIRAFGVSTTR